MGLGFLGQPGPTVISSSSTSDNATAGSESPHSEDLGGGGVANASLIGAAHELLRPLILRRLKSDVLGGELPPKVNDFLFKISWSNSLVLCKDFSDLGSA
jgi:hypothetical protein